MKEVTILGGGSSLSECPYDTEEIWTVNNIYRKVQRITKLFLIHTQYYIEGKPKYNWDEVNRLAKERGFEVISLHRVQGLESKPYPLASILERFDSDYFANSISYLIAFALFKEYSLIKLYGVDQKKDENYAGNEKGSVEFWLGIAKGRGCKYVIANGSEVMKSV